MYTLYNFVLIVADFFLRIIALFNKKISLFVDGRKEVFAKLKNEIPSGSKVIWMHCASLGEFEQGRPIIEKLKIKHPSYKIVLTFFSPSGYEVRKNYEGADVICYLPLDTKKKAKKFIQLTNPALAIFVKYEFWPNILRELKNQQIETILVSGIFRENQAFFKGYGAWMRKSLKGFSHFFVQDDNSKNLLNSVGFTNVEKSGDTRFDRVFEITQQNNELNFVLEFKVDSILLVCGSTWKEDEDLLIDYINNSTAKNQKYIFAPHNIKQKGIDELQKRITKKTVLYSEKENHNLVDAEVLIIDAIGFLTKVYYYADIAYIGGAFATGLHNVLEPATFGMPIIIGPDYQKFKEAIDLVNLGGVVSIKSQKELKSELNEVFLHTEIRTSKGKISKDFITNNVGATKMILTYIDKTLQQ
ncbi:MAG: glycosyltransferase N-terminal domain-containing protein [Urechidicola sp.]|nr:glycosyltransferase N-terminal domain-containing protein [Urechidicola sp.]